jgi:hypothetical protein
MGRHVHVLTGRTLAGSGYAHDRAPRRDRRAFVSGIDTGVEGLCVETFILHPKGSSEPSRMEDAEV